MGDDEICKSFRTKLEENFMKFQSMMSQTLDTFNQSWNHYNNKMQTSLNGVEYFNGGDFMTHHQNARNEAISQVGLCYFSI